jgi:hypothetical protein
MRRGLTSATPLAFAAAASGSVQPAASAASVNDPLSLKLVLCGRRARPNGMAVHTAGHSVIDPLSRSVQVAEQLTLKGTIRSAARPNDWAARAVRCPNPQESPANVPHPRDVSRRVVIALRRMVDPVGCRNSIVMLRRVRIRG